MDRGRRALLLGGAAATCAAATGALGVAADLVPGRPRLLRALHLDGADGRVPEVAPGRVIGGSFVSRRRGGTRCGWAATLPPDYDLSRARRTPIVVALHGRGADHSVVFDRSRLGLGAFAAASVADGGPPMVVAAVDGGDTYWHPRADGVDAGAMVLEEFLPLLRARGLDGVVMFWGWSMGGYGALRLASLLGRDRTPAVAAASAALWTDAADTSPGAFDDDADFARSTLFGRQGLLDGIAVRFDCGAGDPFAPANQRYRDGFETTPQGGVQLGDHDMGYWRRMAPVHLAFLGEHAR